MEKYIKYAFGLFIVIAIIYAFSEYQDFKAEKRLQEMRDEVEQGRQEIELLEDILDECERRNEC